MKKFVFIILLTAGGDLAWWYCAQTMQLAQMRKRLAALEAQALGPSIPSSVEDSGATSSAASGVEDAPGPAATNATDRQAKRDFLKAAEKKILERLQHTAAFQRMVKAQAGNAADKHFADLYQRLGLADPKPLADLLRRRYELGTEQYFAMQDTSLSTEEQQKRNKAFMDENAKIDRAIQDLLTEEQQALYEDYMKTLPERLMTAQFKDKLDAAGLDLTPEQEESLVRMMADGRMSGVRESEDPELYRLSTLLPEERGLSAQEMSLRYQEYWYRRYMDSAKEVLSAEQAAVFGEFLTEQIGVSETLAEYQPWQEPESYNQAKVQTGNADTTLAAPVTVNATITPNATWYDMQGGSKAEVEATADNTLLLKTDAGAGWGSGITFWPESATRNEDGSANAAGADRIVAYIKAPAGTQLRFGLLESGATGAGADQYYAANNADGEAFRHAGTTTTEGWQTYTIPFSELQLNGGYGNQKGNRTIDTQAIKGIELLVPGGQPAVDLEIGWVRLE